MHLRRHTLVLTVAAALVLGSASVAHADLGGTGAPVVCNATAPAAVLLTSGATATYTATTAGVLTSFSTLANTQAGAVRAVVLAAGGPTQRAVVAASPRFPVTTGALNTFPIRLAVRPGEQLALGFTASGMGCAIAGTPGDVTSIAQSFDPDTSGTFTRSGVLQVGSNQAFRPNISAVLEPDADGDLFGDLTQDACPRSALTQAACPAPDTTITKRPKRLRANPKIKVKFTSDIAGSTFQCQLDGRKWRSCTSPYKKRLKLGGHQLKVRAVSPVGIIDGKPAKVKVRITR